MAGLAGEVYGETTPSVTGVSVIGTMRDDYALSVFLDAPGEQLWFAPDLVEFVDHAPGTEISIGHRRWVRAADGEWVEHEGGSSVFVRLLSSLARLIDRIRR